MKNIFKKIAKVSSRQQIQIKEIVDNILVLPNQEYRQILELSSINFELKSEQEQDVIIDSFQNFLNALPSSIQILIRVREIDIDKYIEDISKTKETEKLKAYKKQIDSYCSFVKKTVSGNKILSRRFFIIIPFKHNERKKDWKLIKEHLALEKDIITKGLERMQIKAKTLSSTQIINLFYSFYNHESLKTQAITKETLKVLSKNNYV